MKVMYTDGLWWDLSQHVRYVFQAPSTTLHLEQLMVLDRNMFTLIRRKPYDLRR